MCVVWGGEGRHERGRGDGGVIPEGISENEKFSGVRILATLWLDSIEGEDIAETL